jgi:hypothetical protein
MQANLYLFQVLSKKKTTTLDRQRVFSLVRQLYPVITKWANNYLLGIIPSGSYAKGTSVKGLTDIDLFISLKNLTPCTLEDIYNSLYNYFDRILPVKKQNVSIRVNYKGLNIDLVPAKRMPNVIYPHSVYVNKKDTWTKTNIDKHISFIKNSGRVNEIILMKIWRELNELDFPSFYLELTVIEALKGKKIVSLEKNIMTIFEYLRERFIYARIVDPANSQNIISDDLTDSEKQKIIESALISYNKPYWNNIIW